LELLATLPTKTNASAQTVVPGETDSVKVPMYRRAPKRVALRKYLQPLFTAA
jgi:hypothetical protein